MCRALGLNNLLKHSPGICPAWFQGEASLYSRANTTLSVATVGGGPLGNLGGWKPLIIQLSCYFHKSHLLNLQLGFPAFKNFSRRATQQVSPCSALPAADFTTLQSPAGDFLTPVIQSNQTPFSLGQWKAQLLGQSCSHMEHHLPHSCCKSVQKKKK